MESTPVYTCSPKSPIKSAADSSTRPDVLFVPPMTLDIRDYFRPAAFLSVLSPVCTSVLSWYGCAIVGLLYVSFPAIVRLRYTRFMLPSSPDELLRNSPGAIMAIISLMSSLILQTHDPRISIALHFHSTDLHTRALARVLCTHLYVEMAQNGSFEEREQIASWLRWTHKSVHGSITSEMRVQMGIPEGITTYGYVDELKAFVLATLCWSTLAFLSRYGRQLSQHSKDVIVMKYTCVGLHLGIPSALLSRDYDSFVEFFNRRLEVLEQPCLVSQSRLMAFEESLLAARKLWITEIGVRIALILGYDLLPERVKKISPSKLSHAWYTPVVRGFLSNILWIVYPMLMWLPLRGMICLVLVLEPSLRPIFMSSLQTIQSMDIKADEPVPGNVHATSPDGLPGYVSWLNGGPFLQRLLVCILTAQLRSKQAAWWSIAGLTPWIVLPGRIASLAVFSLYEEFSSTVSRWNVQIQECRMFEKEVSLPNHVGFIMDGNRRWARELGQPAMVGHRGGVQTAANLVQWWINFNKPFRNTVVPGPRYLTMWAFSSDNFKRSIDELKDLFKLMEGELKALAFHPEVHLYGIRVTIIGSREFLPRRLRHSIGLVESSTAGYSSLFLQVAIGYGGRDDIVRSVKHVLAQGQEVTEESIGRSTFCSRAGVPPVDLIVRTSEQRTSGFMLWETQGAELQFIDKLWPDITEMDWLAALSSHRKPTFEVTEIKAPFIEQFTVGPIGGQQTTITKSAQKTDTSGVKKVTAVAPVDPAPAAFTVLEHSPATVITLSLHAVSQKQHTTTAQKLEQAAPALEGLPSKPRADPYTLLAPELAAQRNTLLNLLGSSHPGLSEIATYYFLHPSKQVRPLLVLLFARATNGLGDNWEEKKWAAECEGAGGRTEELDLSLKRPDSLNDWNPTMSDHTSSFENVFPLQSPRPPLPPPIPPNHGPPLHVLVNTGLLLPTQVRLAQIVEMVHVASLLHDDVIDNSPLRRGVASAPAMFGNKLSILGGDFLLGRATAALSRLGDNEVVELIASVIANLVEGEILQMKDVYAPTSGLTPTVVTDCWNVYLKKTYLKTASLMAKAARGAVILGGTQEGEIWKEVAYAYGRNLGIAFQLVDDILDYEAVEATLGKPGGADLQLGIATGPALYAWEEHPEMGALITRKFEQPGDVELARDLVRRSSGVERTRQLAIAYTDKAREVLQVLPDSDAKTALEVLAERVMRRTS